MLDHLQGALYTSLCYLLCNSAPWLWSSTAETCRCYKLRKYILFGAFCWFFTGDYTTMQGEEHIREDSCLVVRVVCWGFRTVSDRTFTRMFSLSVSSLSVRLCPSYTTDIEKKACYCKELSAGLGWLFCVCFSMVCIAAGSPTACNCNSRLDQENSNSEFWKSE